MCTCNKLYVCVCVCVSGSGDGGGVGWGGDGGGVGWGGKEAAALERDVEMLWRCGRCSVDTPFLLLPPPLMLCHSSCHEYS